MLDADDLVGALTTEGEPMSQTELEECLHALSLTGAPIGSLYDIIPPQVRWVRVRVRVRVRVLSNAFVGSKNHT